MKHNVYIRTKRRLYLCEVGPFVWADGYTLLPDFIRIYVQEPRKFLFWSWMRWTLLLIDRDGPEVEGKTPLWEYRAMAADAVARYEKWQDDANGIELQNQAVIRG